MPNSLQPHGLQPTRLLCPWDFIGKDTEVVCHFLLQGVSLTQVLNPGLLHCRQILLLTELPGLPSEFHWVKTPARVVIVEIHLGKKVQEKGHDPFGRERLNLQRMLQRGYLATYDERNLRDDSVI